MKLLLWSLYYAPEKTGIGPFNADLADFLSQRGHKITVLTTFPFFPEWRKQQNDRGRLISHETHRGVVVHRTWTYVPARVNTISRIVHEFSFGVSSLIRAASLGRPDLILLVSPPLSLGFCGWLGSKLLGASFVFHVQDLQPDAAVKMGMLKNRFVARVLYGLEAFIYARAATVSGIIHGMLEAFSEKGVSARRRAYFPNWLHGGAAPAAPSAARITKVCEKYGIPAGKFVVLYSGNMGRKQGLEGIIEAARLCSSRGITQIHFVMAGAGAVRDSLERELADQPCESLTLLPLLAEDDYHAMLHVAGVCVVAQVQGSGRLFFPSKLLTTLKHGRPVLAIADEESELTRAVRDGGFGLVVPPGSALGLIEALLELQANPERLDVMAERSRWVDRFDRETVLQEAENMLLRCRTPIYPII